MEALYNNREINILVVDDNPKNIQIIGQILHSQHYNVFFATSGAEAMAIVSRRKNFDLILLDILMPGMDGFEVCANLKREDALKAIPVIFLTAKSDTSSIIKGLRLGANDYVVKPFNEEELQLRVKTQIDLKKQRERLEVLNQHLEETVKDKTSEVQEAHKKLAILEKAKNDFLVLISHELRTPLNIINGFTEILHDSLRQTKHIEELNILKHSTNRLIRLAETALLITEIRLGKYTLEYDEINLEQLCHKVAKNAGKLFLNYHFGYEIHVNDGAKTIRGDKNLVENVISQITENAIKASQNNSHITFKLFEEEQNTVLEIKDNGTGFSQKDMERLFEIFNKNGPDVTYDGFGLGLFTAKLIMNLHSGEVLMKNNDEGGASVSLVFRR